MKSEITYLGKVINVNSSLVEVEVSREIPSAAPIINGRVYKLGQIGTFVKIQVGGLAIFGIVSSVSNSPQNVDESISQEPNYGNRYMTVELVGERLGDEPFERGVGTFPTINDEVHVVTEEDLSFIYMGEEKDAVEVGTHSSSVNLPIHLSLHHLVLRHSAVFGSTGSGKSNTVAVLLKNIMSSFKGSRIVLVDIHGEYGAAFPDGIVLKINDPKKPLFVPFWAMTFDELSFFLVGRPESQEKPEDKKLREKILALKKENAASLGAGPVDENFITADSPIPFDIRQMWYDFDRSVNATYSEAAATAQNSDTEMLVEEGDPAKLVPAKFEPYGMGASAPYQSKNQTMYGYLNKIYSRLKDTRYDFMFYPGDYYGTGHDIHELIYEWIDGPNRMTILDLSGLPFELTDISVGLITRLIFDSMYWGRDEAHTGRSRPLLLVYEEAHAYLPKEAGSSNVYGYARRTAERIFKEGRKFGVGAMIVSQRPSEVSSTILSQVGTFISLRLSNSQDKGAVQSAAPNNMTGLIDLLPSLRVGEAIIVGESIKIPSRVRVGLMTPRPKSDDPKIVEGWKKEYSATSKQYKRVVASIREARFQPDKTAEEKGDKANGDA